MPAPEIAVIGLGYVGRPLAEALAKHYSVIGYDINPDKLHGDLPATSNPQDIADCDVYIVSVPTPLDHDEPDLRAMVSASHTIGALLRRGDLVVYESTTYPGCTEEVCMPMLEAASGMMAGEDFDLAYSPERINPGDTEHTVETITKVVSGLTERAADRADAIYCKITKTHRCETIRAAEASRMIENTQRDVNIALMNEFAMTLARMDIDAADVFEAARTKWNFKEYTPGLVGGHCVAVDPNYMLYKAAQHGIDMPVTRQCRATNEGVIDYIADRVIANCSDNPRVLVMGAAFKPDCEDTRNSKGLQLADTLRQRGALVDVFDPVTGHYTPHGTRYDAVVVAIAHSAFKGMNVRACYGLPDCYIFDVHGVTADYDARL